VVSFADAQGIVAAEVAMGGKRMTGGWRDAAFRGTDRFTDARLVMQAGMSRTYETIDQALGERVWIKEVPHLDSSNPEVVVHEYETLRRLTHLRPHVLRVHELFVGEHDIAFSSERLAGVPRASFEPGAERLRYVMTQLVLAIDAVHRSGVVHRDIKPAHIFETHEQRLVLLGFELAASTTLEARAREAGLVGTPAYMAPEVIRGKPATEATDFYAIGTLLFEALTGRLPFEPSSLGTLLTSKIQERAPLPSEVVQGVPADLDQLCGALLDRDPARRPGATTILRALGASPPEGAPP
jgi:eukaryotic-like serine/threonine-protein kinase